MRFKLSATVCDVEVIGEVVELPNADGEIFAVHHAIIQSKSDQPDEEHNFAVSHVGTGLRAAVGETIDEAIENAVRSMAAKTPDEIRATIKKGHEVIRRRNLIAEAGHD
jgi:hypothetical protein